MDELADSLRQLAERNVSGVAFLVVYGATWTVVGILWRRAAARTAAYATLFQGAVAFPVALALSALIGAIGTASPVGAEIRQLSILIGTSQLLGLPFLVYLIVRKRYALVPFAFAAITSMHFVLYAWLYRTPVYIVMAALIALGTTIVMLGAPDVDADADADADDRTAPSRVSFVTGGLLLATGAFFVVAHAVG